MQQGDGRVAALPSSSEHRWQATPLGAEWLALEAELFKAVAASDVQPALSITNSCYELSGST
jgi:hypothetical protein